eukprot:GSChrysophyteH2.ASY1.ANO1.203.1 assembled CDS
MAAFLDEAAEYESQHSTTGAGSSKITEIDAKAEGASTEAAEDTDVATTTAVVKPEGGKLLLSACHDWEHMTGKDPVPLGLDGLHNVPLPEGTLAVSSFSSSSSQHMFVLLDNGQVLALGRNQRGQAGTGAVDAITLGPASVHPTPVTVPLPSLFNTTSLTSKVRVVKLSTGKSHSLLLADNGSVYGCGSNEYGQLGLGEGLKVAQMHTFTAITVPNPGGGFGSDVADIACGHDHSILCTRQHGFLYSFGHPEHGQLGHGDNGEFIARSNHVDYNFEKNPRLVESFVRKDAYGKTKAKYSFSDIRIRKVACGKNHSICVEDWEGEGRLNRVFSFGYGGYGRLGHGSGATADELFPREVTFFSEFDANNLSVLPHNSQKRLRHVFAGSSFSLGAVESGLLYHWGKMSSARGGEATMAPKIEPDTQTMPCAERVCAGHNCVALGFNDCACVWGAPPAGKYGLQGGARSSTVPKYVPAVDDLCVVSVSAGYGHIAYVLRDRGDDASATARYAEFPNVDPVAPAPPKAPTAAASFGKPGAKKRPGASAGAASKKMRK